MLYAMVYGAVPFRAGTISDLHKNIINGTYVLKNEVSEEVRDLLSKMLEVDPNKRLTIPQILCHPWFSDYNENIHLFTQEEIENIQKEFTYAKRERNQGIDSSTSSMQSDWFIEQNIDQSQSELTKNETSKSFILAPFNSTITDENEKSAYAVDDKDIYNKRIIKYDPRVKEIDRQYERNNNCEVDNGVYNDCDNGKEGFKQDKNDLNPLADNEKSIQNESGHEFELDKKVRGKKEVTE